MKIWQRLVIAILTAVVASGAGLIYWATLEQKSIAIEQAKYFANSVHQMTLAGLTGMMITGTISLRPIFLDQIKEMNHVESLKVLRGDAVVRQFGPGFESETPIDPLDAAVVASGESRYEVVAGDNGNDRLRAVIPARALENYLGKNCTNCHHVPAGTVLGAVSMEISLAHADQTVRNFSRNAALAALAVCVPLGLFIWLFITRMVSRPLARMTAGLDDIASGEIDEAGGLAQLSQDEVGLATGAFNRVMAKAQELLRQQRLSRIVFENSLEGITVTDAQSNIQAVNKAFTDTTGYSAEEVIGRTPAVLKSGCHGEEFYAEFWQALKQHGEWRGEIRNRRKNGSIYVEWLNVSAVRDRRGEVEHYVAIFSDITERKHREEAITFQAFHDALTGLPNRLLFRERLEQSLQQARRHKYRTPAVLFLDLDRFKQVNDSLGHEAGDALLKEVARRLRSCIRASDTVARLAGDEFTVLLPEISAREDALEVADKIIAAMTAPVSLNGQSRVVGTSIGIAMYPRDGRDADTLLKHADVAMYQAKRDGLAGKCCYADEFMDRPSRRLELEQRLRSEWQQRHFVIVYRDVVNLADGQPHARWAMVARPGGAGDEVLDSETLGLAEDLELIIPIGQWLLENACSRARQWQRDGSRCRVAVTLTAAEFRRFDLVPMVRATLRATGVSPECLEIAIPQGLLTSDGGHAAAVTRGLSNLGIGVAIDDYAPGLGELPLLRDLHVDAVRISPARLREQPDDPATAAAFAGAGGIAAGLGLALTAVAGIDQDRLVRALAPAGGNEGQVDDGAR